MAENTNIEWDHATFNPWSGCTKVSPACDICYAEVNYSVKMRGVKWGKYGNRIIASDSMWKQPLAWNRKAIAEGVRKRVFCASLADVFEGPESMPDEAWPAVSDARERLGALIDATPWLDWLLLTKRPQNVLKYGPLGMRWTQDGMPANVWIGTTVENQKYADERIPELLKIPATVRFLSIEPMLGPVDLSQFLECQCDVNGHCGLCLEGPRSRWVICGGESGGLKARPMHPDWVRGLRDQCVAASVPFHFKQWGEWLPLNGAGLAFWTSCVNGRDEKIGFRDGRELIKRIFDQRSMMPDSPRGTQVYRVGKKESGRLLDGREWNELPT